MKYNPAHHCHFSSADKPSKENLGNDDSAFVSSRNDVLSSFRTMPHQNVVPSVQSETLKNMNLKYAELMSNKFSQPHSSSREDSGFLEGPILLSKTERSLMSTHSDQHKGKHIQSKRDADFNWKKGIEKLRQIRLHGSSTIDTSKSKSN